MTVLTLPKYLQHDQIGGLYELIGALPNSAEVIIDFGPCQWAEHFELHKLATILTGASSRLRHLEIKLHDHGQPITRMEVAAFANRIGFFDALVRALGQRLTITLPDGTLSLGTGEIASVAISQRISMPSSSPWGQNSYFPITSIQGYTDVERITEQVDAGGVIQAGLAEYGGLESVASGELAYLVVHELAQNIAEHAWSAGQPPGQGLVSLTTRFLGTGAQHKARRLRAEFGPAYERSFLVHGRIKGYVELNVSDAGIGIVGSLRAPDSRVDSSLLSGMGPDQLTDAELLAAAFGKFTTRDPGPHRPGNRGLFHVAEFVREYGGLLACQSSGYELVVWSNPGGDLFVEGGLTPVNSRAVVPLRARVPGTHHRILLPLAAKPSARRLWQGLSTSQNLSELINAATTGPPGLASLPDATSYADTVNPAESLQEFRNECGRAIQDSQPIQLDRGKWIWMSAGRARRWRKLHIQAFLEELRTSNVRALTITNIPTGLLLPFIAVARHYVALEDDLALILVDQLGQRTVVNRGSLPLCERFIRWGSRSRGRFVEDESPESRLLGECARALRVRYDGLSLDEMIVLASARGIESDFAEFIEQCRVRDRMVRIDAECAISGFIELDEALQEQSYLSAMASFVTLARGLVPSPTGTVILSRAAERLLSVYPPFDYAERWLMPDAERDSVPTAEWLEGKRTIFMVTDALGRGETLAHAAKQIDLQRSLCARKPDLVIVAPLLIELTSRNGEAPKTRVQFGRIPGTAKLFISETLSIPILYVHRLSAEVVAHAAESEVVRDPWTNTVVEDGTEHIARGEMGRMPVAEFIRLAEAAQAIIFGHTAIAGEHFDLEFDVDALLVHGRLVLEAALQQLLDICVDEKIDLLVYPDASRVQPIVHSVQEGVLRRESRELAVVRVRRTPNGDLVVRAADRERIRRAGRVLLLDDAINSGRTLREMIRLVTQAAGGLEDLSAWTLLSRQHREEAEFWHSLHEIAHVRFHYSCLVHIPISFVSSRDCLLCRRITLAEAIASSPRHIAIGYRIRAHLRTLRASDHYRSPYHPSAAIDDRKERTVLMRSGRERFGSLAGAKAAVAVELSDALDQSWDNANDYVLSLAGEPILGAWGLYLLATRRSANAPPWSDGLIRFYEGVCRAVGRTIENPTATGVVGCHAAFGELAAAAWHAPVDAQARLFTHLVSAFAFMADNDAVSSELWLLGTRLNSHGQGVSSHTLLIARRTVESLRRSYVVQSRGESAVHVPRLIRLGEIQAAIDGGSGAGPWIERLIPILSKLSLQGRHERISYLNWPDLTRATTVRMAIVKAMGEDVIDMFGTDVQDEADLLRRVNDFAKGDREFIRFLAENGRDILVHWFRSVHTGDPIRCGDIGAVVNAAEAIAASAQALLDALYKIEVAVRQQSLAGARQALDDVISSQQRLRELLFDEQPSGIIRSSLMTLVTPLYDIAKRFDPAPLVERAALQSISCELRGKFVDYAERVKAGGDNLPQWLVLLCPIELVEEILQNVLVTNVLEHVFPPIATGGTVELEVNLSQERLGENRITLRRRVLHDGRAIPIVGNLFRKTLGAQRTMLLNLYGGDIRIEASDERSFDDTIAIDFIAGEF
jgi:hypothetical protein